MTGNTDGLNVKPSQWVEQLLPSCGKSFVGGCADFPDSLNAAAIGKFYLQVGLMSCPPSRNGNMHVVRARPRHTHGETQLQARMRTTIGMVESQMVMTLNKPAMWGNTRPTHGAFFDMYGNVFEWANDWYQAAYPTGNPVINPSGPASASYRVFRGGSWNNVRDGLAFRKARRQQPRAIAPTTLASVSVSKKANKARERGKSWPEAEPDQTQTT